MYLLPISLTGTLTFAQAVMNSVKSEITLDVTGKQMTELFPNAFYSNKNRKHNTEVIL
ncbi:hypothetical protein J2783_004853 [Chryseobacterium sediminis]|jgi:hypothetical protein|nr:hypothetical protein [Chryseobacterium sediminis]